MYKCSICGTGEETKTGITIICMDCINKGFVCCDMHERCIGTGYLNKEQKKDYSITFALPSTFFRNDELKVIDNIMLEEIAKVNNNTYCCIECYKNAILSIVGTWHGNAYMEKIMEPHLPKIPNEKPFFDKDGEYWRYIENLTV